MNFIKKIYFKCIDLKCIFLNKSIFKHKPITFIKKKNQYNYRNNVFIQLTELYD